MIRTGGCSPAPGTWRTIGFSPVHSKPTLHLKSGNGSVKRQYGKENFKQIIRIFFHLKNVYRVYNFLLKILPQRNWSTNLLINARYVSLCSFKIRGDANVLHKFFKFSIEKR